VKEFTPDESENCLTFDADFECGNLGNVERTDENEYNLEIRQDTNNPKFRLWFYFSVSGYKSRQTVLFHINNFSKNKSLYRNGQSPIVKIENGEIEVDGVGNCEAKDGGVGNATTEKVEKWYRLPPATCYYYKPKKDACYCLSFVFKFPEYQEGQKVFFAYCFPYSYSKLQRFLKTVETDPKHKGLLERELLADSTDKRRVDLLTITSPTNFARISKEPDQAKSKLKSKHFGESSYVPVVFLTARVHPGETPASFIMQTIIEFLLSPSGKNLRKIAVFKIVPMINPDGVVSGNYRCNAHGHDLNRCYREPSAWQHPEIFAIKDEISKYLESESSTLKNQTSSVHQFLNNSLTNKHLKTEIYVDIHGHSCLTNSFMYGNLYENDIEKSLDQHILPNLMDKVSPDYSIRNTSYNCDEIKNGSGRRTFEGVDHLYAYTLEVSMSHYFGKFNTGAMFYDENSYSKVGESLMKSVEQYFTTRRKGRKSIATNSRALFN
jgi:hypothetical protein